MVVIFYGMLHVHNFVPLGWTRLLGYMNNTSFGVSMVQNSIPRWKVWRLNLYNDTDWPLTDLLNLLLGISVHTWNVITENIMHTLLGYIIH